VVSFDKILEWQKRIKSKNIDTKKLCELRRAKAPAFYAHSSIK